MFLGTYLLTFSGKGRIILPKKFRKELKKPEIVLMKGIDKGIWGFSEESWIEFTSKLLELSLMEDQGRKVRRKFFPNSEVSELDKQGRFVISDFLLKEANIKDKIVLVGAGDHFEIWNNSSWWKLVKKGEENG